jgi:Fe-S-cluster containining protein
MSDKPAVLRNLQKIYDSLPEIDCKKLCGKTNCGPAPCVKIEQRNIRESDLEVKRLPYYQIGEKDCLYLSPQGTCEIYEARPLICRLFGVVDTKIMRCPHGCIPDRWLTEQEARAIMETVFRM